MKSRDFVYWLQGYLEIASENGEVDLNKKQVACIKKHLAMVFKHEIDPSMPDPELDKIHEAEDKPHDHPAHPHHVVYRC